MSPTNLTLLVFYLIEANSIYCSCSYMNFSRNISCLKCKAEGPKRVGADAVEMKKGDWNCPE